MEVILPSGSEIDAFMITVWLISPSIGVMTAIIGGSFTWTSNCPKLHILKSEDIVMISIVEAIRNA
jgi:hypothetical protein